MSECHHICHSQEAHQEPSSWRALTADRLKPASTSGAAGALALLRLLMACARTAQHSRVAIKREQACRSASVIC